MLLGALWECLENFVAHNTPMDIVWNATGLLIGAAVRMMISRPGSRVFHY